MLLAPSIYHNICRPYQQDSHDQVYTLWQRYQAVLLTMPGGGGKTLTAASIVQRELREGKIVWFVAHRRELILNAQENLFDHDIQSGIIMGGFKPNKSMLCQVGSIQTIDRRLELPDPDTIVFDEGHRARADSYKRVRERYPKAKILGLTGTPFSTTPSDPLINTYDAQVSNILSSELMAMGATVPCSEYLLESIKSKGFATKNTADGPEYDMVKMMRSFDQDGVYNSMINGYKEKAEGKKTIVFCCNVAHSIETARRFTEAGYRFAHIDGDMPKFLRDGIIREYKSGNLDGLTNYGILAEGFDVPNTECVILNLNTASMIKYFQACWRGSRPFPGKSCYILIDMGDNYWRFGDPQQDIICDLDNNYIPKGSAGSAPQKTCKGCKKSVRASAKFCEHCNSEFIKTLEEVEEERLVQLSAIEKKIHFWKRLKLENTYMIPTEELESFVEARGFNEKSYDRRGYDKTWLKKELARREKGYKKFKLMNYTKANLKQMEEILQRDYHEKRIIPAKFYQFVEETDHMVTFNYIPEETEIKN